LRLLVAHASVTGREELEALLKEPGRVLRGVDVVVTTYGFLQRSEMWMEEKWGVVILDEAQAIKNPGSGATKAVKR
jgi:non-specific serine/threonine protein kinase